jgi:hypothetical protein
LGTPKSEAGVPNKQQVLASLNFQGQTGEKQPADSLREIFVGTHAVNAALDPSTPLVIGRKGTGKTLVFRQLLSQASGSALAITSPSGIDETQREWQISEDFYEAISDTLDGARSTWVHAWMAVIGLTLVRLDNASPPHSVETLIGAEQKYGLAAFVSDVRSLLAAPDSGIMLREWLLAIDGQRSEPLTLLFDGLDTGFGTRRDLRNEAVTGLMVLLNDLGRTFRQLRLKAFIREDIFRSLSFPNKSHLRADAAVLVWNDQTDYLRIIIRQAWRSPEFRQYAEARLAEQLRVPGGAQGFDWDTSIEYWPDDVVGMVWRLLAGERVAGGKTAFTDNWVWARLADANGDHAPRHLVELFIGATRREIDLEAAGPFPRALIRPKSLVDALEAVSESAIEALAEEFPELDPVLNGLKAVGITPFDADGLKGRDGNLVGLAAEVGVLDRGNDGDSSERYRVPEIYRKALGMSRRGQK